MFRVCLIGIIMIHSSISVGSMLLEGEVSPQGTNFRRLLENPDYEKPGPHQGPRLVREIPRLANKQEEIDARFAGKSPPSPSYAHDPAIRKNVWASLTTAIILYWDRNTKHSNALVAWDKFFTHRLPSNFKYRSLQYNEYEPSDIAVVYSSYNRHKPTTEYRRQIYHQQVTTGRHVLVVDMAFFRRADGYYAVSWEVPSAAFQAVCGYQFAFSGLLRRIWARNMTDFRWNKLELPTIQQPKPSSTGEGGEVLVLGQVPWDNQVQKIPDYQQWLSAALQLVRRRTQRPVAFRPATLTRVKDARHDDQCMLWTKLTATCLPRDASDVRLVPSNVTIEEALAVAEVVVSYNSNGLLDALIAGKAIIALSSCTPAVHVSMHNITSEHLADPIHSDHATVVQLLHNLAYYQYSEAEIEEGLAWDFMMETLRVLQGHELD